jgi:hypothetical protein
MDCLECGFRDFFKIPVDDAGKYGTAACTDAAKWRRKGKSAKKKGGH